MDDIKLDGKKQNIDPMWKELLKDTDLEEPTSCSDQVYFGSSQRECETSKDIVDNCRNMYESKIAAGAKEKIHYSGKPGAHISSWSCHIEGHAKKCVERYCEIATKQLSSYIMSQLHAFTTIILRTRVRICWRFVNSLLSNCRKIPVFGPHWQTRHSVVSKQICTSSHKMDQRM